MSGPSTTPHRRRVRAGTACGPLLALVLLGLPACDDGTEPSPPTVGSVTVSPGSVTFDALGDTVTMDAQAFDTDGTAMPDAAFSWSSSDVSVATVSPAGEVVAVGNGTATIEASAGGVSGTADIEVAQVAVGLTVSPQDTTLVESAGATLAITAEAVDANGYPVADGVTFTSSDTAVATVDAQGVLTVVDDGQVTVTVDAGSVSDDVAVTVVVLVDPRFSMVSAGFNHTCAITVDGTAYCWGANNAGQLGDASTTGRLQATPVTGGLAFDSISAGSNHSCAVTAAGAGYCWGNSDRGQVGDGGLGSRTAPAAIAGGHAFTFVEAGRAQTCGVTSSGQVFCWGWGANGALGNGTLTNRSVPDSVSGTSRYRTVRGFAHTVCAVRDTGDTDCWGRNNTGQVGDGTVTCTSLSQSCFDQRATPTRVSTDSTFVQLSSGARIVNGFGGGTSCGVTAAGTGYCWGQNDNGQIGDGSSAQRLTPTAVTGGHPWRMIDVGSTTTCGVTMDGQALCWGANANGVVGDGTQVGRLVPTPTAGGLTFAQVSVGFDHACGVTPGGRVYCWGRNDSGQLGLGNTTASVVPASIVHP